jgi:hypothetical protein
MRVIEKLPVVGTFVEGKINEVRRGARGEETKQDVSLVKDRWIAAVGS